MFKVGLVDFKRELYYENNEGNRVLEVFKGSELYEKLGKSIKGYKVDCQAPLLFSSDVLKSASCSDEFFYISPIKTDVIVRCYWYNDLWYRLNVGKVRKRSLLLVWECINEIVKSGFSDDSSIVFIKGSDRLFHLIIDGVDCGFLGDDSNDVVFKNALSSIFKDIGSSVDVVVFPSKGRYMFFSDTVAVYKTVDNFFEACLSKKIIVDSKVEEYRCDLNLVLK